MKIFVYLSVLLFSAGAVFGLVDYVQAEKKGTLKKVYAEPPISAVERSEEEETLNEDSTLVKVADKRIAEEEKDVIAYSSNKKGTSIKDNSKAVASRKNVVPNGQRKMVKTKLKKKIIIPTPPRKISIRDFGRSSLRE